MLTAWITQSIEVPLWFLVALPSLLLLPTREAADMVASILRGRTPPRN